MKDKSAKNFMLGRLRQALRTTCPEPFPGEASDSVFVPLQGDLIPGFIQNFENQGGVCLLCADAEQAALRLEALRQEKGWKVLHCQDPVLSELFELFGLPLSAPTAQDLCPEAGITGCQALSARTGSILLSERQPGGETLSLLPMAHIVVATVKQLFADLGQAFLAIERAIGKLPDRLSIITGPSRTADIEKTLVLGAHAPKELYLLLLKT